MLILNNHKTLWKIHVNFSFYPLCYVEDFLFLIHGVIEDNNEQNTLLLSVVLGFVFHCEFNNIHDFLFSSILNFVKSR